MNRGVRCLGCVLLLFAVEGSAAATDSQSRPATPPVSTTPIVRMQSREAPATQAPTPGYTAELLDATVAAKDVSLPPLTALEQFQNAVASQPLAVAGTGRAPSDMLAQLRQGGLDRLDRSSASQSSLGRKSAGRGD